MTAHPVTVNIPRPLYARLQERAAQAHRSVEAELLEVLAVAVPAADDLPSDLAEALAPLPLLDDAALWWAARSHLPAEAAAQLEALHLQRQREGLTETEAQTLALLVRQYERAILIRVHAAMLLKQRGHDVGELAHGT